MGNGRRQSAATLGRIYPYRAAKQQAPVVAAADARRCSIRPGRTGWGRRQSATTLGRIYPYRAAKQQAPVVAATDARRCPIRPGRTTTSSGMTGVTKLVIGTVVSLRARAILCRSAARMDFAVPCWDRRRLDYSSGSLGFNVSRIVRARDGETSLERSSNDAAAIRATEPKCISNLCSVCSPTPLISLRALLI